MGESLRVKAGQGTRPCPGSGCSGWDCLAGTGSGRRGAAVVGRCCRGAVIVDRGFERGGKVWGKMRLKCSRSDVGYLRQQANVAMLVVNAKMGMASDNTAPE